MAIGEIVKIIAAISLVVLLWRLFVFWPLTSLAL